jgi:hypothetical protein
MERSPRETNGSYDNQEIRAPLWNSKASLPCSQEPSTSPYPELNESYLHPRILPLEDSLE